MNSESQTIYVYADWLEMSRPILMGNLYVQQTRGKEIFSFKFDSDWLKSKSPLMLDPDLNFFAGRQFTDAGSGQFGIFLDSSPDRWGCQLIRRREAIRARKQDRPVRKLNKSDYLLAVHDETRMGAIRYKSNKNEKSTFYHITIFNLMQRGMHRTNNTRRSIRSLKGCGQ